MAAVKGAVAIPIFLSKNLQRLQDSVIVVEKLLKHIMKMIKLVVLNAIGQWKDRKPILKNTAIKHLQINIIGNKKAL